MKNRLKIRKDELKLTTLGFTLIELIVALVILAIIALIVTPLLLNVVRKATDSANKRSVDAYGKAIDLAVTSYLMEKGNFPTSVDDLTIEYSGSEVICEIKQLNEDSSIYLSKCSVGGVVVKDSSTDDGFYHYGKRDLIKATETLIQKANSVSITDYNNGDIHEMYTFTHDATEQTEALTDYRYIGKSPYNYVKFNNELWRIIGVFTVEDAQGNREQRIKIVRNEFGEARQWNTVQEDNWPTANLQTYFNGEYYNSLREEAKAAIGEAKYYLGGRNGGLNLSGPKSYEFERATSVYYLNSPNWTGKIGLMYPSDYAYTYALGVDSTCYTNMENCSSATPSNSWLYSSGSQWFISADNANAFYAWCGGSGYLGTCYVDSSYYARPTAYLLSSVYFAKGTGTADDPYTILTY